MCECQYVDILSILATGRSLSLSSVFLAALQMNEVSDSQILTRWIATNLKW